MRKSKKILTALLCLSVCTSLAAPVLAAPVLPVPNVAITFDEQHPDDTMKPTKKVFPIGAKAFYKITGNKESGWTVVYADRDLDGTYTAVPSAFIKGSEYNVGNIDYGMYVTDDGDDGKFHVVALDECHLEDDGSYTFYHGTTDGATVSEDVDTATNSDPTMATEFYLNVANGLDPDGGTDEEDTPPPVASGDNRVEYEITVATRTNYNLNATVPMYVCMYGYRASGDVVTPTQDAYRLKNYSTINPSDKATIKDIVRLTHLTKLYDKDHSNDEIFSIAFNKSNGEYTYWYSDPTDDNPNVYDGLEHIEIKDRHINASGENYVICIDRDSDGVYEWEFYAAGVLDDGVLRETVDKVGNDNGDFALKEDFVYKEWNFGKTPYVGQSIEDQNKSTEGMPIKVSEIQAVPSTWRIVPSSKGANALNRGEIVMTMAPEKAQDDASAIDLASTSGGIDITDRGWYLDAPTVNPDTEVVDAGNESSLGMNVNARIAGGNVNDAGCTSVVKVHYTVSPVFDVEGDKNETNTVPGGGTESNRDPNEGIE